MNNTSPLQWVSLCKFGRPAEAEEDEVVVLENLLAAEDAAADADILAAAAGASPEIKADETDDDKLYWSFQKCSPSTVLNTRLSIMEHDLEEAVPVSVGEASNDDADMSMRSLLEQDDSSSTLLGMDLPPDLSSYVQEFSNRLSREEEELSKEVAPEQASPVKEQPRPPPPPPPVTQSEQQFQAQQVQFKQPQSQPQSQPQTEKPFLCPKESCPKSFSTLKHLRAHERTHTGEKPFLCPQANCGKAFATNYSLKSHLRVHTGDRPYKCTTCEKCFKTSGDMHKHIRTHTGERPFSCDVPGCLKSFTTSNILKVHKRTHTGERPYHCTVCKKTFASHTNLKNHKRIHSGEKPYACEHPDCGRRFTEYSSLFKHQLVHAPFKPYPCRICDKGYRLQSTLVLHMKTAHNVDEDFSQMVAEPADCGGGGARPSCQLCTTECHDDVALAEHMSRVHGVTLSLSRSSSNVSSSPVVNGIRVEQPSSSSLVQNGDHLVVNNVVPCLISETDNSVIIEDGMIPFIQSDQVLIVTENGSLVESSFANL